MDTTDSRAMAAYFRAAPAWRGTIDQPASPPDHVELEGRHYVVLRNIRGILAVYRVRNSGALKRLRRWPREIETTLA